MALTLAQVINDRQLKKEENWAGSLLSESLGAGGDYAYNINTEELMYLVTVSTGETPSEQKNESKDSLNTPSAEALNNLPSR